MEKIQLVNLKNQYQKIKNEMDKAILDVVSSTAFINGPVVKEFQSDLEKYLNVKHVIPCANGTDALQISLMALGLKPGDEVITPSFTYVATVEVMALLGLIPKFIEVDENDFTLDPSKIEKLITDKTKAIVPVHLYGQCADMEPILNIANKHNIKIVEDTAQAIGASYTFSDGATKKAGTIGDIGTTSFFPSKNLGCYGDGGAIFTNSDELADLLRKTANHGQTKRYHHDFIGVNSRLDSIQAAILKTKLPYLDEYNSARFKAAEFYNSKFENYECLQTPFIRSNSSHVFHQYTLKLDGIDQYELGEYLASKEIPSNIYYPIPVHLQKGYSQFGYTKGSMPLTESLCSKTISLPMHSELGEEHLNYITSHFCEFLEKNLVR